MVRLLDDFGGRQLFPPDNWWNQDVSQAPVDANSRAFIDFLSGRSAANPGAVRTLHPDFGPPPYGIPYVAVGSGQPRVVIGSFLYASESDAGVPGEAPGYPLPEEAGVDPSGFSPHIRRIFQAMKTCGLILADNGSDLSITGTMDSRWNNDELNPAFRKLRGDDFEVIQLGWR